MDMTIPFVVPDGASVRSHEVFGGVQHRITFPNGWGASVVRHPYSYGNESGLWELAVLGESGGLNYDHPVSQGDVRGRLTEAEVASLLAEIASTAHPVVAAKGG